MTKLKIGVRGKSLGVPLRRALEEARRLAVSGIELDALGDLAPRQLSQTGRRELLHLLRGHGLALSALNCPLRHGFDVAENLQPRLEHVKEVMALSYDLGPRLVVVNAGRLPEPEQAEDPRTNLLKEALLALGQHGDRVGTTLALETGLESGATLRAFLDRLDTGSLAVSFNPANLLVHGFEVYPGAKALAGRVKYVHAKDARSSTASRSAQDVPLGHGDIDWLLFLGTLEEIEYRGWLVVEREGGASPLQDVAAGVRFLRRLVGDTTP
jgi:sugar phosphate isomerase/epimerase